MTLFSELLSLLSDILFNVSMVCFSALVAETVVFSTGTSSQISVRNPFAVSKASECCILFEPRCDKTGLRGFRPGPTQTGLYSYTGWLEA